MQSLWTCYVMLLMATVANGNQQCTWDPDGCIKYPETFCHRSTSLDESQCKTFIINGDPCCMAGPDNHYGYLCFNTSYDGPRQDDFKKCLTIVEQCERPQYLHPVTTPFNQSCQAYSGDILGNQAVISELQCMDVCMRDTRCTAYNIKEIVKGIDCQLLGRVDRPMYAYSCNSGYTGKLFDRTEFHKAYMNVGRDC